MPLALPPTGYPTPQVVSSFIREVGVVGSQLGGGSAVFSANANRALFVPFKLDVARTYNKAWWVNGATVSGNIDVGIYTISGATATRIVASTAEAQAGVSVMQLAAAFTQTTLQPGNYFLAISASSVTATVWRVGLGSGLTRQLGVFMGSTAHPLPATQTVIATTLSLVPLFGISELTTI